MSLQLYNLTIQRPTSITSSIVGQFSGKKSQEIVVARGSWLELFRLDANTGKLNIILSQNCFGILRSIASFRIAGSSKDYIAIGSDSGRITILEYNVDKNTFVNVHLETFGKTGVRRVVPGQYLAVDPKGRACMIASVEKNKLVYVLNRDSQTNLTISSPLEAHTANILVYYLVAIDVGYENPVFAFLEVDHSDVIYENEMPIGTKRLTYYELDLGLNHVIKKWTTRVDRQSNILVQVPGGNDGPSGVLVGTHGYVTYYHAHKPSHQVLLPRREGSIAPTFIVSAVMHKMRGEFFFLLQSNMGDLFKVSLEYNNEEVLSMTINYFDTIPVTISLNILKLGYLFAACESGNHILYQFLKLGDDDVSNEFNSRHYIKGDILDYPLIYFNPRSLDNLVQEDCLDSLNPLMGSMVTNITNDDMPQIYTISGQGKNSAFKSLEYGLVVNEIVASELPAVPLSVWTTKIDSSDQYDKYIILSFSNETTVLSIGENVEEVTDSGFLSSVLTIAVQQLGDDSLVQIHSNGIRHISAIKEVNEWTTPDHTYITAAASNNYQVAILLSNHELVYFEVDEDGQLNEYDEHKEISGSPVCISIGDVPAGRLRSSFLAIGCSDATIRIFSLELGNTLETLSIQALTAAPTSVKIMNMSNSSDKTFSLHLHIGLATGVYIVSVMDSITGQLSDTRTRFLGPKPIKLFSAKAGEESQDIIIALSSKTWIGYVRGLAFDMIPLSYPTLNYAWTFSSEDIPKGVVAVENNTLRIFSLERLGGKFKQESVPLSQTPRRLVQNSFSHNFYVIGSDNNTSYDDSQDYLEEQKDIVKENMQKNWASTIEIVEPIKLQVVNRFEFEKNEAAFAICSCRFETKNKEYLIVGTAVDQVLIPKSCSSAFIRVYDYLEDGKNLCLVHKTKVAECPIAMIEFQGKLLVGVGNSLIIYDLGLKQLLRKAELKLDFLTSINSLNTQGERIILSDIRNSIVFVVYKELENELIPFADDVIARHITCSTMLDYDTCAAGDRFGNIFILRCSRRVSELSDEDEHGIALSSLVPSLNGTGSKLELVSHFYCQDIPTSLIRTNLVVGGPQVIIYTGIQGTIGALIPFATKEDAIFFQQLEGLLREEVPSLVGRDHLAYRGYYAPVKATRDGDLCEVFEIISYEKQERIADQLDRTVAQVERKIADMRTRAVF